VRGARINRLDAYRTMYDTIGAKIAAGEAGDSAITLQRSAGLVLDLEERHIQLLRSEPPEAALEVPAPAHLRLVRPEAPSRAVA
jgi:hypothetical protein